jgi:hypothetical protein
MPAHWLVIGGSEAIALGCLVHLWQRPGTIARKLFWSTALFVPVIGPLFFGAFARPLPPQPEGLRAQGLGANQGGFPID